MALVTEPIGQHLEQLTYEYFLMLGLSQVPDSIDKRQGSIIWDSIAPMAYVCAEIAAQMRQIYKDTFVLYATGEYLDLLAAEIGLTRYEATYAVKRGYFYDTNGALMDIPIPSRYAARNNTNNLTYIATSEIASEGEVHETGIFLLTCEVAGRAGNQYSGDLVPITTIPGLARAIIQETIVTARDRETDDELRQRYIDKMNEKPFGGNVAQYKEWMRDMEGVGAAQIYPIWNGGGTVKISIIDNEFFPAAPEFIEIVQRAIDPQDELPSPVIRYYGGNPVSFTTTANRISDVRIIGRAIQSGTGTPSASNPRPISGVRRNPSLYINGTGATFNTSGLLYGIPVPGGNSINDEIMKTNGTELAVETHNTKLVTLTGTESWTMQIVGASHQFLLATTDAKITEETVNTLSSYFPALTSNQGESGDQGVFISEGPTGAAITLSFEPGTGVNSLSTFRTWMSGKGVQVLYQIETPTYTNQTGIEDVLNPAGTVVVTADDDANLAVGVISQTDTSQLGLGIAPIGHKVTVVTPNEFEIDVRATLVMSAGYDSSSVLSAVTSSIEVYFQSVRESWGISNDLNEYDVVVYQSNVIVRILAVPGVVSVTTCLLNGVSGDVVLTENSLIQQLPVLGAVTLS